METVRSAIAAIVVSAISGIEKLLSLRALRSIVKSLSCDPCDHSDHLETIDRKAGNDRCVAMATILCFTCLNEKRRNFFLRGLLHVRVRSKIASSCIFTALHVIRSLENGARGQ